MPHTKRLPVVSPRLLNGAHEGSQWSNLGFWRGTRRYPEAARELARRVGRAAGLGTGDVVLDYACGHGDSLALWVREFGVAQVIGVEPDTTAAAAAAARVRDWGLADRIRVCVSTAEAFLPTREASDATAVVCVDAAYHFADRSTWMRILSTSLAPGTRVGFSDISVSRSARRSGFVRGLARRAGIPEANLWLVEEIESACAAARIATGRLVRCGPEVLGGFARHALRSAPGWLAQRPAGGWRALGTAAAITRLRRGEALGYVIVAGRTVPPR